MKNFDVLSQPHNFYTKKTIYGGIASIIIILLFLIILNKEFSNLKKPKISKNLYLDPNPNQDQIKVNIDILM